MEGPTEKTDELPRVNWADHINRLEIMDHQSDPHRARGTEMLTEEAYGMIDGWDHETTHSYIHDIITVQVGVKLQTKAAIDENASPKKFLNNPKDVEFYIMWLSYARKHERLFINSTDPDLAREIHHSFFEVLMQMNSATAAFHWLTRESRYAKMKSPLDSGITMVDHMPIAARKKIREFK